MHFIVDICQQWWRDAPEDSHVLMHLRNVKLLLMTICIHFVQKNELKTKILYHIQYHQIDFF